MKKRTFRIAVVSSVAIIIGYIGYYAYVDIAYSYSFKFLNHVPCAYLFSAQSIDGLDTTALTGCFRKTDQIYTYVYKGQYYITVWKIKALRTVDPKAVKINKGVPLDNVHMYPRQALGEGIETDVKLGPFFKYNISVDVGESSDITNMIEGSTYRGFYGTISKMGFQNEEGEILAIQKYTDGAMPTLFLVYKRHGELYLIIVNCDKPFGLSLLDIFNLK